jgi:quercetin dioxygenase-like cupin family protein
LYSSPFLVDKEITVLPQKRLSLQLHNFRSEQWHIVEGIAIVNVNHRETLFEGGMSLNIPLGCIHRVRNGSDTRELKIIELQISNPFMLHPETNCSVSLSEDDIVRLEDDYGRV